MFKEVGCSYLILVSLTMTCFSEKMLYFHYMHTWFHVQLDQKILDGLYWWAAYLISKCKIILLTFIEFRICPFDLCLFSRRANFVNLFVKGQNSDIYQTACKNVENSYHQCHHSMGMSCSLKRPFEYKNKGKMNTENEKNKNKIKLLFTAS